MKITSLYDFSSFEDPSIYTTQNRVHMYEKKKEKKIHIIVKTNRNFTSIKIQNRQYQSPI